MICEDCLEIQSFSLDSGERGEGREETYDTTMSFDNPLENLSTQRQVRSKMESTSFEDFPSSRSSQYILQDDTEFLLSFSVDELIVFRIYRSKS